MATRKTAKSQTKRSSENGLNGRSKESFSAPDAGPAAKTDSPSFEPIRLRADAALAANANSPSFEQIRLRAYEIFKTRGGTDGNDVSDWLEAERQLSRDSGSRTD